MIEAWGYKADRHSRVLAQFLQKRETPLDEMESKYAGRGGGDATYVAKGGDVTEILKKMLMEYEDDLVALDKAEAETKAAYDLADDAKKLAIQASTKSKETKEEVLGEKGQELSNTQSDLKEAQDALLADTTVLQLKSVRRHNDPKAAVIAVLRKVGGSKRNVALSKLADKIEKLGSGQMPGSQVFDQIKNMIQKMIFHLMDEQKNEDEHKHWCDKEITNTELMIKEKTEKSADSDSTITQLAEKIQDLKNGIEANQKFIAETEDEISSRTEDRAADKKENQATIDDAEDAQTAIAQAIAVLKTFYKESGEVAKEAWESFVQLKVEPEPELWKEEEYTGTEGGAAVIGMLENCATDFAAMESQARADETAHQDAFDTFLTQAQMDKAARTKDTEMKEARKGRFEDQGHRTKDTEM